MISALYYIIGEEGNERRATNRPAQEPPRIEQPNEETNVEHK